VNRRLLTLLVACAFLIVGSLLVGGPMQAGAPGIASASDSQSSDTTPTTDTTPTAAGRWIGFYQPGAPQQISPLSAVESQLGTHVSVTNFFRSIEQSFTDREVENAAAHGSIPLITLEFSAEGKSTVVSQPGYSLANIANGKLDPTIVKYAQDARDSGHEIWIRPFHEMNGYWYPWSGTMNGNTPSGFLRAWRHVHDIFLREGASNVKFVWCPNIESLPNTAANSIAAYYPGDDYVDYMALDGYNFSTTLKGVHWRPFADLFAAPYNTLCSLSATKPIFVAETASVSTGGDKAAWIAAMFRAIPQQFPRVVGVDWFNSVNNGHDWPVNSSSSALQAFRLGVANGSYSPGLTLSRVRSSISIKPSATKTKLKRTVTFSGVLTPGQRGDRLRIDVTIPKHRPSHTYVYTSSSATWSWRYKMRVRGRYYVRVSYAGDSTRLGGASKTIRIVVK
jgi:hypothetical protein